MKLHKWSDIRERKFTPEQLAELDRQVQQEILQLNLQALRKLLGKTQAQVTKATRTAQADLSEAERRNNHLVSILRRYVEALGGQLEVFATFGDKKLKLDGV